MDDFGMNRMRCFKPVPLPYLNHVVIMEKRKPCMVPAKMKATKDPMISAMRSNVVVDALSLTPSLASITVAQKEVTTTIKAGLEIDLVTSSLKKLVEERNIREFWLEDGLLLTKGKRIYVLRFNGLRKALIRECHDIKWAGHQGQRRTRALVKAKYYWPRMRDDIDQYALTCLQLESTGKSPFEIATGH
ncbi:hypothetical protein V2J09_006201 [Rumex salicifolius]